MKLSTFTVVIERESTHETLAHSITRHVDMRFALERRTLALPAPTESTIKALLHERGSVIIGGTATARQANENALSRLVARHSDMHCNGALRQAAQKVVDNWETGDLAKAVRNLAAILES